MRRVQQLSKKMHFVYIDYQCGAIGINMHHVGCTPCWDLTLVHGGGAVFLHAVFTRGATCSRFAEGHGPRRTGAHKM